MWGLALIGLTSLAAGQARAALITFEADSPGSKPNGFTSAESAVVHFSDSLGANLFVSDFGAQSIGQALGGFSDDPSLLIMDFDIVANSLSLVFGNDDPGFSSPGDIALLTLFLGAGQVGQTSVVLNRNDLADQTIAISGGNFNRAEFAYANSGGTPINLVEIVDNVEFTEVVAAVPEPSTFVMGGTATLLCLGFARRRRSRSVAA